MLQANSYIQRIRARKALASIRDPVVKKTFMELYKDSPQLLYGCEDVMGRVQEITKMVDETRVEAGLAPKNTRSPLVGTYLDASVVTKKPSKQEFFTRK